MKCAGIIGLGMWASDVVVTNDAWPRAFVEAFRAARDARRTKDFTLIEQSAAERPFDALFVKHALTYDDDPFKGATVRRFTPSDVPTAMCDGRAARAALEDARRAPGDLDLVMASALVPDRLAPCNGPGIARELGVPHVATTEVEGFCASAVVQLEMASALVESGRATYVACVQSHHIGRLGDREGPTSPIFGDASTAFVVGPVSEDRGLARVVRGGDATLDGAVTFVRKDCEAARWYEERGGAFVPGTDDAAAARLVARNALAYPIATVRDLCAAAGVPLDDVAALATIQPMVWYAPAVADGLGLPPDRVPSTYGTYAHIGGCGVVANLIEARRRGLLRDGAHVVLYAHGAGITRYGALLCWSAA